MRILIDTHMLLWSILQPEKLPPLASQLITNSSNGIAYSAASVWEIEIKHLTRPDKMPISSAEVIGYCERLNFDPLPITNEAVLQLETLQRADGAQPHKDPFDRIMICQAKANDMVFLTHDTTLAAYEEPCVLVV